MTIIRAGSGLGDSLYLRAIVEYLVRKDRGPVIALSDYPEVFIGSGASVEAFRRHKPLDMVAHYVTRKGLLATSQFADMCIHAGIPPYYVPLEFTWEVRNRPLVDNLRTKARGRPIVLVHGGRAPMARTDGFGAELLPRREAFEAVLEDLRDCYLVRVGKGAALYRLPVDVDLSDSTSVSDIMDLGASCDGAVSQCCFMIPLAEGFGKPLLTLWASAGLNSSTLYVRQIVPEKILSKPTSRHLVDDITLLQRAGKIEAFRNAISMKAAA